jgi:hypothetical protein
MLGQTGSGRGFTRASILLVAMMCWLIGSASPSMAQIKICECKFRDSQWQAFGTKALCSAWMRPGRTSCVIDFGGIGADPKLVEEVLGIKQSIYKRETYNVVVTYLEHLRDNKIDEVIDPKFLSRAGFKNGHGHGGGLFLVSQLTAVSPPCAESTRGR